MDADHVAQRALDLHEKAFMPLSQALELALSEATPSPIWPCAKLVIKDGQVSLLSHQYAPGLPDGEHDVYPLLVDSATCPAIGSGGRLTPHGIWREKAIWLLDALTDATRELRDGGELETMLAHLDKHPSLSSGVSSDSQTSPGIPASSALDSSASGESTSGQVHSGDAPACAPLAGGSDA